MLWKEALFWGALQTRNPKTGRDNTRIPELGTSSDLQRSLGLQAKLGFAGCCLRNWELEATVSQGSPGFHTLTWERDKMNWKLRLSRKPYVQILIPTLFLLAFLYRRVQKIKILNFSASLASSGVGTCPTSGQWAEGRRSRGRFPFLS